MPREYPVQCWSCLGEFDAGGAVWCTCSARTPTKLCPFCFHCFCQADIEYQETFWNDAPSELKEERGMLTSASDTLGEKLIRSNLLNTGQLLSALKWQKSHGGEIGDALVKLGLVSRENVDLIAQGRAPEGATVDLSQHIVDASLITLLTVELCYQRRVLPISREEIGEKSVLTLAMAGPTDVETIDRIQSLTACTVIPMSAEAGTILQRLSELFADDVAALQAAEETGTVSLGAAPKRVAAKPAAAPKSTRRSHRAAAHPEPFPEITAIEMDPAPSVDTAARADLMPDVLEPEPVAPDPAPEPVRAEPEPFVGDPLADALIEAPAPAPARGGPSAAPVARSRPAPAPARPDATPLVRKILSEAIARRASSVQLELRPTEANLFFRIDGMAIRARLPSSLPPADLARAVAALASLPAGDAPAAGRIPARAGDRKIDFVVRRLPSPGRASLILKRVEAADVARDLEHIGLSELDRKRLGGALDQPRGLILISAPPHNGLEATRVSLMASLARAGKRVSSIESPILLNLDGARQEEVPFPASPDGIRAAAGRLQGMEVLFLPEIQDAALASLAVEKAADCLVVAPIQARRASQVPAALLWHNLDPAALAGVLRLIANQRLVRRVCDGCRGEVAVADKVLKMMGLTADESLDLTIWQGAGCDRCSSISPGYLGRVALFEILEVTEEIAGLIGRGAQAGEIEREGRRAGMSPLRAACLSRVGQGATSLEEFQKGNF